MTGQTPSRQLRTGRYMPDAIKHPGKMLPTISRYAIHTYTSPGDIVLDPMAGIGTTVVEAMHLGRHGIGIEYEPRWADLAAANIRLAERHGATGRGNIYAGDARRVLPVLPDNVQGQAALIITSPPYGASVHGRSVTPGRTKGKVHRIHDSYGRDPDNLAHRSHGELAAGFTEILTASMGLLRPGGHLLITARPYRRDGELIDIPGMAEAAGIHAGFHLVENCIALICAVHNGQAIRRASFFQQKNVGEAIAAGDPQWLVQHEDAVILRAPKFAASFGEPERPRATVRSPHEDQLPTLPPLVEVSSGGPAARGVA
ncbi:TRM11 family SAM-dependent methyltransferase [Asanoa siamensis]|uniref:TRM11 family SAM-dependent methyltransferase n=1 Tax=Asanoa siamensis TaxID=926357 RepID=UPI001EF37637|nr:DNA methyltransferase [Asanoa siamensis]